MFFNIVHLYRLISSRRRLDQPVKLVHEQPEGIAENRTELHQDINTRSSELFKRDKTVVTDFTKRIIGGLPAEQSDNDSYRLTFGFNGIESPKHLGNGFRIVPVIFFKMPFDNAVGNERSPFESHYRRYSPWIDGVDIST